MSDVCRADKRPVARRQRSIPKVHYLLERRKDMARPLEICAYDKQVAGHRGDDKEYIGLLQCNDGTILKPILSPTQRREVNFYTRINADDADPDLVELRKYVARYYGCRKYTYNGVEREYIILQDLTAGMLEPCIMDIKIGKRTWDPLASEAKIHSEEQKYRQCKQQYSFCVPGYLVWRADGPLRRGKDFGKRLHGQAVIDTFRTFLNATSQPPCRSLVVALLAQLWRVRDWAAHQHAARLYCCSLLLVYDASRLRECCHHTHDDAGGGAGGTGGAGGGSRLLRCHSPSHDYQVEIARMRQDYRAVLERLAGDSPSAAASWTEAKLVDFAHAFFEPGADDNFKEGIDSVVGIFEEFLAEADPGTP